MLKTITTDHIQAKTKNTSDESSDRLSFWQ